MSDDNLFKDGETWAFTDEDGEYIVYSLSVNMQTGEHEWTPVDKEERDIVEMLMEIL